MSKARKLLYPFSLLYGGVMLLRNTLYEKGLLASRKYKIPVIAVGNLSVGGTGKSPMVEYLVSLLKKDYRLATLSRGYKRSSRGFRMLTGNETASEVGDEPLQFKNKYPDILVAVDEDRRHGIEELLKQVPPPEVVLLDDAFQHRKVQASAYILLTAYGKLYSEDLVLPAGNLREPRSGAERADLIVVTKCPQQLSEQEQQAIKERLRLRAGQELFFSRISYSDRIYTDKGYLDLHDLQRRPFTLVTGIADPRPLVKYLKAHRLRFEHSAFPDHHNFSASEIRELSKKEFILTTEKDYMRLRKLVPQEKLYYLPIRTKIIKRSEEFERRVLNLAQKK